MFINSSLKLLNIKNSMVGVLVSSVIQGSKVRITNNVAQITNTYLLRAESELTTGRYDASLTDIKAFTIDGTPMRPFVYGKLIN